MLTTLFNRWCITILIAAAAVITVPGSVSGTEPQKSADAGFQLAEQIALVQKSIDIETSDLSELKIQLSQTNATRDNFLLQTNTYKLLLSTLINQLHFPDDAAREIEKAGNACQETLNQLTGMLAEYKKRYERLNELMLKSGEQRLVNEKNLTDISDREKRDKALGPLVSQLRQFQKVLDEKKNLLEKLTQAIGDRIQRVGELLDSYTHLSEQFNDRIKTLKKKELLRRQAAPLVSGALTRLATDAEVLQTRVMLLFSLATWYDMFAFVWEKGVFIPLSFAVVLTMVTLLAMKCHKWLNSETVTAFALTRRWTRIGLELIEKTTLLSFITLFLTVSCSFELFFKQSPVSIIIVQLLTLTLFILWLTLLISHMESTPLAPVTGSIRRFLKMLLPCTAVYVVARQGIDSAESLLISYRLALQIAVYIWLVFFWKKFDRISVAAGGGLSDGGSVTRSTKVSRRCAAPACRFLGFMIIICGIVLELLGYGTLAQYWFSSWGKTLVVGLWGALGFLMLTEWNPQPGGQSPTDSKGNAATQFSMQWLIRMMTAAAFIILCLMGIVLSWGTRQTLFQGVIWTATYSFHVGSMTFSIISFFQALVVLVGVHFLARVWRRFFQKTILDKSGVDIGLQESMTTITIYAIWIFGIFIALHVFGLNTTTVTVAFGALGIGLGFGLQNIFNNFVSGIILLFERPIQVGDDIEVNGTWATVTRTNVRSTFVQTYDNATIIIPNSDLVSNQVINWSFKDKRLRRSIAVGVEYGSDIELVRTTLLEIVDSHPRILKYPKPDVIFNDFADSALIFTVRFWTFIASFLATETDIRFKIDTLFKERGLVIAFPQQDIHIRSVPAGLMAPPPVPEADKG